MFNIREDREEWGIKTKKNLKENTCWIFISFEIQDTTTGLNKIISLFH